MSKYEKDPYWHQEKEVRLENRYGLATFSLDEAIRAEQATFGEGEGEITKIAGWIDAYLDARRNGLKHKSAARLVHKAIKESSPYTKFPELKPHEYGDVLHETTTYVAEYGSAFWNGELEGYAEQLLSKPQDNPKPTEAIA